MKLALSPQEAWQPLPAAEWTEATARHLLRRVTWSAPPAEAARALQDGLAATLDRLFPTPPPPMPTPASVVELEEDTPPFARKLQGAAPEERRELARQARERSREALLNLTVEWLQHARQPAYAATEKWTLFLGNVYVVAAQKVPNTTLLCRHQELLRTHGAGPAPALTKAVLRSPAMINYLDLQQSRDGAPNENFARELLELFTLGLGRYTERDIQEAARALTGYTQRFGEYQFVARRHDAGAKTLFGRTGRFDGDDVIDLIYEQPAAGTHLPARLTRFYLTDEALPDEHLEALAAWWRGTGYDLRQLTHRYFSSRLFFDAQFRGACIKSPVQYYLGLLQDFSLDVPPLPRRIVPAFRQMGQTLYNPPNVRGWVGGRDWISSTTLEARRLVARALFQPIDRARLNADEQQALEAARALGRIAFTVSDDWLKPYAGLGPEKAAAQLLQALLPLAPGAAYRDALAAALAADRGPARPTGQPNVRLRNAAIAMLETPEYQLC